VIPAIKWQISPVPGKIDFSATFGAGLPTGNKAIAGPGVQPYVQFPWSWELGGGWGISGMFTNFIVPADPTNKLSTETTFVLEREFAERAFLFIEYVGYYHVHGGPSYLINSGGGYRITPTQQIDFHIGIGLNDNAPAYISVSAIHFAWMACSDGLGARPECTHHLWRRYREICRLIWFGAIGVPAQLSRAQIGKTLLRSPESRAARLRSATLATRHHCLPTCRATHGIDPHAATRR
jgi:hypothetical protein